jgi:hypothetical protein
MPNTPAAISGSGIPRLIRFQRPMVLGFCRGFRFFVSDVGRLQRRGSDRFFLGEGIPAELGFFLLEGVRMADAEVFGIPVEPSSDFRYI